jgi:hypothetical protein
VSSEFFKSSKTRRTISISFNVNIYVAIALLALSDESLATHLGASLPEESQYPNSIESTISM